MSPLFIFTFINIILFILFILLLPFIAIINLLGSSFKNNSDKLIWFIIILIIPILGSILYFLLAGRQKIR